MTPEEYNHLVELRNKCYRDRVCRETDITYFTGFNDGYEKGKEIFEKENAELKDNFKIAKDNEYEYQSLFIKAKEIIREFVEWANWQGNSKCPSFKSIQDKAEQFISEVEK